MFEYILLRYKVILSLGLVLSPIDVKMRHPEEFESFFFAIGGSKDASSIFKWILKKNKIIKEQEAVFDFVDQRFSPLVWHTYWEQFICANHILLNVLAAKGNLQPVSP